MQSPQGPDAPDGDRDLLGHSEDDALVQEDPTAGHVANVDERRPFVSSLAPTQPHLTNVTTAATPTVLVSNDERILAWMFIQPAAGFVIEYHREGFARQQLIATSPGGSTRPARVPPSH
jgi:hypothetical protein